jgi:murein DD-endopeptidase MepM/ murein hydrolase activator NlpD
MLLRRMCAWALALAIRVVPLVSAAPASAESVPPAASSPANYVVRAGDTLFSIATRYHTDVAALAHLNGIVNPMMIYVGQPLTLPTAPASPIAPTPTATAKSSPAGDMVYTVQSGETLFRIALKYGTTASALAAYNKLASPSIVYAGQQLLIPSGSKNSATVPAVSTLPDPFVSVDIAPLPVIQGNTIAITVLTSRDVTLNCTFLDWSVLFAKEGSAYHGLVGIHAMQKPGVFPLTLIATDSNGKQATMTASVQVMAGKFGYETIKVSADKQRLLAPNLVNAEREKLYKVLNVVTPTRYWNGLFKLPGVGIFSSVFGSRRTYVGGVFTNYHEGADINASGGSAVYAPADGVVALAEPLTVRGNAVLIDHGWGIYSGLYHMSKIEVKVGQFVRQGQVIGRVGTTGLSTGPHLHWDVRVRGLNVDPLQWTRRIFP